MNSSDGSKSTERRAEAEIFDRFSTIVKDKFTAYAEASRQSNSKVNQLDILYKRPEFSAEKKILNDMNNNGLSKGLLATLASFIFLRWSPGAISRHLRKRAAASAGTGSGGSGSGNPFNKTGGYKLDPPSSEGMAGRTSIDNAEKPGLFFQAVRLCVDTFVSLSVGAYASMYFLDSPKMMKQASEIPLVEGRSLLSEELCRDFSAEFKKYNRRTWDPNHQALSGGSGSGSNESNFKDMIEGFVVNCKRRSIYEEDLRNEQGLSKNDAVVVPSPGVPRDISVTFDDLFDNKSQESEFDDDDVDFFDKYFDSNEEEN
mmetsp:Transcript_31539/g.64990  ORF Transcript_31539/g.64990 Transcript_31539/m.64990 type:complete len:315 (+) Transcript_31539:184-1128(+)